MVSQPEDAKFGLPEEAISRMLKKNVPERSYSGESDFVSKYLIPNIVEVISANNEAILFQLKDESSTYDSKY